MAELTAEQQQFGKLLSFVNGRLMFAYLDSGCQGEEMTFVQEKGKCYPKSWRKALDRLQKKQVIKGYFIANIDGEVYATIMGFNPNAEYFNQSRQNIANFWLDIKDVNLEDIINKLETLPSDDFKFTRKHKARGNDKLEEVDKEFAEADRKAEIQKAIIKKAEVKKAEQAA